MHCTRALQHTLQHTHTHTVNNKQTNQPANRITANLKDVPVASRRCSVVIGGLVFVASQVDGKCQVKVFMRISSDLNISLLRFMRM